MLFGCSSFHGTEAKEYYDAFALLRRPANIAPKRWLPPGPRPPARVGPRCQAGCAEAHLKRGAGQNAARCCAPTC